MTLTIVLWVTPKRPVAANEMEPFMQLVLEVCDGGGDEPPPRKVFDGVGGVVGRGAGCDWSIPPVACFPVTTG